MFRYETHNEAVRVHFGNRPTDLLEICLDCGETASELAYAALHEFLGCPSGVAGHTGSFPHKNKGTYSTGPFLGEDDEDFDQKWGGVMNWRMYQFDFEHRSDRSLRIPRIAGGDITISPDIDISAIIGI